MGLIPLLLALGAVPAAATSLYYTIDFTLTTNSPLPTSGSFWYDTSTHTFADFEVLWDGESFDFTGSANASPFYSTTDPCYSGATTGSQDIFLLLTTCSSDANPNYYTGLPQWYGDNNLTNPSGYTAFGFDTTPILNQVSDQFFTGTGSAVQALGGFEASTPEPGTWALTLIGLALAVRKRVASGLSRQEH
jgi:hypothetical protein